MPELPDITVYIKALERRILGQPIECIRIKSPFLLRTFDPPIEETHGKHVRAIRRLGKRIAFGLDGDLWLVLHLMIAGRLHWKTGEVSLAGKHQLAAFVFPPGTLVLSEAGSKHRASLSLVRGESELTKHDPGGLEVRDATPAQFAAALRLENHTIKRALTDPRLLSGIGNAYSDEILHRAKLSPLALTHKLTDSQIEQLRQATLDVLDEWTTRLRDQYGDNFPENVTAYRPEMAVHGRYGLPCPVCGAPVQRIRYADNETNYCARCQTGGRILADRSLSRLLKDDWPRHLDEL
jgi:formamidopyrimidine-DNA glycosylase